MTITLNNYEEYFLLLADNELSPAEEILVKQFATQHPHLQEELQLLMACRLDATDMPLFPKENLLRPTIWNIETPEPIYTQMLNLLDNELPASETESLKYKIAASPVLQAEWNTLQKTLLSAEAIVYPNKESLYRRHKIRPLVWMRWAAAAAVLAIGWLLWPNENNNGSTIGTVAALSKINASAAFVPSNNIQLMDTGASQSTNIVTTAPTTKQAQTTKISQPVIKQEVAFSSIKKNTEITQNKKPDIKEREIGTEPVELAVNEPELTTLTSNNLPVATTIESNKVASRTAAFIPENNLAAPENLQNSLAAQIAEPDEHEGYVHIAGARVDKHKMRGLSRGLTQSVARTFTGSKIKPEDAYATTGK